MEIFMQIVTQKRVSSLKIRNGYIETWEIARLIQGRK